MTRRWSVAVIQGGASSEAEVSRSSAREIAAALKRSGHQVVRLELDEYLAESVRTGGYEVAFPIAHGAFGEDGSLQGLLEILGVPYVGSGVLASALAMDKGMTEQILRSSLPTHVLTSERIGPGDDLGRVARRLVDRGERFVLKPAASGSALGVLRFDRAAVEEVRAALKRGVREHRELLVQPLVVGREVTVGVIDLGEGPRALPIMEVRTPSDPFYNFEARYVPGRSEHVCPADLGLPVGAALSAAAVTAHSALGCRDLSRVDFVLPATGDAALLEVNSLPGFTPTSLFPEAAAAAGHAFDALVGALVALAVRRGPSPRFASKPLPK